jgi:CBS domain-containing protein
LEEKKMNARELMTERPETLTPDAPITRAAQMMRDLDVGMIPIVEADGASQRLKGVITDRDIVIRHVAEGHTEDHPVSQHMTEGHLHTVRPDDSEQTVMRTMKQNQVRRVLVVDDDQSLVGVIAQADVADALDHPKVDRMVEEISQPAQPNR